MITKPTVLVLGAGASTVYGYPAGKTLKNHIVTELNNSNSTLYNFLRKDNYSDTDIGEFREGLIDSATNSIDEFLENRQSFIDLGKLAITFALAAFESPSKLRPALEDWYQILVQALSSGASFEGLASNKIAIITFNYDRSLEQYLFKALKARFGKSEKEVAEIIKKIPIVHVHGQIGYLPWQHSTSVREYGNYDDFDTVCESSKLIRTIHEANDPFFEEAQKHLLNAGHIYFLGFGYHALNLRRLKIEDMDITNKIIQGTSFGLNQKRLTEITNRTNQKINIMRVQGAGRFGVYQFLDENITFI